MATLTIRNIPDGVKQALRERAARHGVSMEEEARRVLERATSSQSPRHSMIDADEIMRRARMLCDEKPSEARYETMTQKEISDELWRDSDGL